MVEVFKTDVTSKTEAKRLLPGLAQVLPSARITFDLEDCDHILRVEAEEFSADSIIRYLESRSFQCSILI